MCGAVPDPHDPLYPLTHGRPKAMLEMAGKPMVQWVLDALNGSELVEGIVVVGLGPESSLTTAKPVSFLPDHGGAVENALAGVHQALALAPKTKRVLLTSCDVPTVTTEMIDWRIRAGIASGADFDYLAIERSVMEARFPGSRRTYTRLRGMQVCGGDINVAHVRLVNNRDFIEKLTTARKSPLKMASILGWEILGLFLTRQLTMEHASRLIGRNLGIAAHFTLCPYAEMGMDIDKPHQFGMLRDDLIRRSAAGI